MGRALVVSGGSSGLYVVRPLPGEGVVAHHLPKIDERLENLDQIIADATTALETARNHYAAVLAELRQIHTDYAQDEATQEQLDQAQQNLAKADEWVLRRSQALSALMAEQHNLTTDREALGEALNEENEEGEFEEAEAWCADLTESLEPGQQVGTIEINGVPDHVLISPGGGAGLGEVEQTAVSTPSAVMFNWALMPWWQRWRPTYRIATITDIDYDNDTCSVVLREAESSLTVDQHGYPREGVSINPKDLSLSDVPIEYMECNARAFAIDDSVVVQFTDQSWENPVVIGFEENPRPCMVVLPVQVFDASGSNQFVNLANSRISELYGQIAHLNYLRDEFIPNILNYFNQFEGKCRVYNYFGCWATFTADHVAQWKKPWIDWRDSEMGANNDLGYNSEVDGFIEGITNWQNARNVAQYSSAYIHLRFLNTLYEEDAEPGSPISANPVMAISCISLDDIPEGLEEAMDDILDIEKGAQVSAAAQTLWEYMDGLEVPAGEGSIYVSGLISMDFKARGIIYNNHAYIIGCDFVLDTDAPETTEFTLRIGGENALFRYPSPHNFTCAIIDLQGNFNAEAGIYLSSRVSGRLADHPTEFGATIVQPTPWPNPWGIVQGFGDPGGVQVQQGSFMARRMSGNIPVPRGFESFAGRYPDHPIVTNRNFRTLPEINEEIVTMEDVNNYVHTTYSYIPDEENYDYWQFLSNAFPAGDCEDFALTKIQMLLERGWDIRRLRLAGGFKRESYNPPRYNSKGNEIYKYVGHIWVLVDDSVAMDDTITTHAAMSDLYPYMRRKQTEGLWWKEEGDWPIPLRRHMNPDKTYLHEYDKTLGYRANPTLHYTFDTYMVEMKARHRDYPPSE